MHIILKFSLLPQERLHHSCFIMELVVVECDEGADEFSQGLFLALGSSGVCIHVLTKCDDVLDHRQLRHMRAGDIEVRAEYVSRWADEY